MLNTNQLEKLKANWGDKANSLDCLAEVRVYDPLSSYECFIYALNPEDNDEIQCIINGFGVAMERWSLKDLFSSFNGEGDPLQVDHEYRPRNAQVLFKILQEKKKKWTV